MSRVTSERCRLTPDDTTNAQLTTLSPPIIINKQRETGRGEGRQRKCKQVSKQKQRKKKTRTMNRAGNSNREAMQLFDVPFD